MKFKNVDLFRLNLYDLQDEMAQTTSKKGFRIFVARIPSHATEGMFRRQVILEILW